MMISILSWHHYCKLGSCDGRNGIILAKDVTLTFCHRILSSPNHLCHACHARHSSDFDTWLTRAGRVVLCKVTASHCTTLPLYNCTHHREMLHDSFTKTLNTEYTQEPPTHWFHIHSRHILMSVRLWSSWKFSPITSSYNYLQLSTIFHNPS